MRILLTSAGAAVALERAFAAVVAPSGGTVVAADADPLAPTLAIAETGVVLPPPADRTYVDALLHAVEAHRIDLIVPLADAELPKLAATVPRLHELGCVALVSLPSFVEIADDKLATVALCRSVGIRVPATWERPTSDRRLPHELFVRPRRGSGGHRARVVRRDELDAVLAREPDSIVQEHVRRAEVTVDALLDLDGRPLHYVPRLRLRVEAGRSVAAVTVRRPALNAWIERVLWCLGEHGARGPIALQAFVGPVEPQLIEVNARFAHGVPLAIAAGGDHPRWIVQVVGGEQPACTLGDYRAGVSMATYAEPVFRDLPAGGRDGRAGQRAG